jgi:hypothetical protein
MTRIFAADLGLWCSLAAMVALIGVIVLSSLISLELIRSDKAISGYEPGSFYDPGQSRRMHRLAFPRSKKRALRYVLFGILVVAYITYNVLFANDLMNNNLLHLIPQVKQSDLCYSPRHITSFVSTIGICLFGMAVAFASFRILGNLRSELSQNGHSSSSGFEIGTIHNQSELLRLHTQAFPKSRKRHVYVALSRVVKTFPVVYIVLFGIYLYCFKSVPPTFSPCR